MNLAIAPIVNHLCLLPGPGANGRAQAPRTILDFMAEKGGTGLTPPLEFLAAKARKLESK